MILAHGTLYEDSQLSALRERLEADCLNTIASQTIQAELVISACDALARQVAQGRYDHVLAPFLTSFHIDPEQFQAALHLFRRESLEYKVAMELGPDPADTPLRHPGFAPILRRRYPLGVLLHIAAGNVDGLPAYSVVEGLLAGNINILKLPSMDHGASLLLLHELVTLEPRLRDFVYVFDVPSTDLESLTEFARVADGVVVWGGDEAVKAARQLASPDTRIIPWGHKLSFAYATPDVTDRDLAALARHICLTRQLLCSSCQGIFLDTEDMDVVSAVAERFFHILQGENAKHPPADVGLRAKAALQLCSEELEAHRTGRRVLRGGGVSVTTAPDSELELSWLAGNCWVKPLPRGRIISALKRKKGYLQTVGLLCSPEERETLGTLLARAGLVRITEPGEMSRTIPGEAHDGTYPLREYTRVAEMV